MNTHEIILDLMRVAVTGRKALVYINLSVHSPLDDVNRILFDLFVLLKNFPNAKPSKNLQKLYQEALNKGILL
jgi:hypothetical protein